MKINLTEARVQVSQIFFFCIFFLASYIANLYEPLSRIFPQMGSRAASSRKKKRKAYYLFVQRKGSS